MGTLRLLLALGVVTEHAGNSYFVGSYTAIQIFFMISGFYMALIWSSGRYESVANFYASRCARLFPAYWVSVLTGASFAFLVFFLTGTDSAIRQMVLRFSEFGFSMGSWIMVSNSLLISSDMAWFIDPIDFGESWKTHPIHLLIQPPVWTLALEIYFYALCPFFVRAKTCVLFFLFVIVIMIRIIGYNYGLDSNPFHARLFPFELALFLLGVLTYRLFVSQGALAQYLRGPTGFCMALGYLCVVVYFYDIVKSIPLPVVYGFNDYMHSLMLYFLSVPAFVGLFYWTANLAIDRAIGELSYPIYISHYAFVSTLLHTKLELPLGLAPFWVIVLFTFSTAVLIHLVIQRPVDNYRVREFAVIRT